MTQVTRRELMPGVWLRAIHTDKFKSSYLGLTMMAPLEWETAAANALIPAVLRRGTAAHPDLEALSAALDEQGGQIRIVYDIELDHALAGRNTFDIQIRQARR